MKNRIFLLLSVIMLIGAAWTALGMDSKEEKKIWKLEISKKIGRDTGDTPFLEAKCYKKTVAGFPCFCLWQSEGKRDYYHRESSKHEISWNIPENIKEFLKKELEDWKKKQSSEKNQ